MTVFFFFFFFFFWTYDISSIVLVHLFNVRVYEWFGFPALYYELFLSVSVSAFVVATATFTAPYGTCR